MVGKPSLVSQIKFNSYPENISITNNNSEKFQEFLISGNSFDGLSIVSLQNNQLKEKKIIEKPILSIDCFIEHVQIYVC